MQSKHPRTVVRPCRKPVHDLVLEDHLDHVCPHISPRSSFRSTISPPLFLRLTHVVQLSAARVHGLEQLINFFVRHFLAEVREDVAELADADEAGEVFVEDLETTAVLFGLAWVAETARSVQDAGEGVEVNCVVAT